MTVARARATRLTERGGQSLGGGVGVGTAWQEGERVSAAAAPAPVGLGPELQGGPGEEPAATGRGLWAGTVATTGPTWSSECEETPPGPAVLSTGLGAARSSQGERSRVPSKRKVAVGGG